jgi:ABC-type uncharacterized transport system permease subunit
MIPTANNRGLSRLPSGRQRQRRTLYRRWLNRLWFALITLAGGSVIVALLGIFFYLLSGVMPLFKPVSAIAVIPDTPAPLLRSTELSLAPAVTATAGFPVAFSLIDSQQRYQILAATSGEACLLLVQQPQQGCVQRLSLTDRTVSLTALTWLSGRQSLVSGDSSGQLKQWFLLPDQQGQVRISWIKPFLSRAAAIVDIAPEQGRSGFAVLDQSGTLSLFYANLSKPLWQEQSALYLPLQQLQFSKRNEYLWLLGAPTPLLLQLDNRHPEISWRSLFQKVWYEGWQQPEYVWQSSGGAELRQGKYSLVPLTIGTLKAAFYALLVAVPLGVLAALYTACFLSEPLRSRLSNLIELMALFPTVIIGFLAAIWLAPALEQHLLSLLLFLLSLPLLVLALARLWPRLPARWQNLPGSGWDLLWLSVLLLATGMLALTLGQLIQQQLFDGSFRFWLNAQGVSYQQRNALVVGLAMGFSVLPVIFTICYAVMSQVPRQLTLGASALGATHWQIVRRVIWPLSLPGVFAAVMLGLGRALGETMIILMATGNAPISNFNLFEGLRSLTATLTIELPEAAVDSSHYRMLFLVAILLFVFTFTANTLADLIRQRLQRNFQRLDT